jgi:hypothetical protein
LVINCKDSKLFWNFIKDIRRGQNVKKDSNISPMKWFNHFSSLLKSSEDRVDFDLLQNYTFNDDHAINLDYTHALNDTISDDEIIEAVRKLKSNKSPGTDGLCGEMYKKCIDVILPHLAYIFNTIFRTGSIPDTWCKSIIVPLLKKGDVNDVRNYRGISLINVCSKIFTSILNNRLNDFIENTGIIPEAQAGFRKGYSTIDNAFTLHAIISGQFNRGKKCYCIFVDFARAFDTVQIDKLLLRLSQVGITGNFYNCIVDMYKKISSSVKVGKHQMTNFFDCNIGLRQGCMLSPSFFSIFIAIFHDMIERRGGKGIFIDKNNEIKSLFFADDIVLMANSVHDLQRHINILAKFCDEWGLEVNVMKTKAVVFRRGGRIAQREMWFYKGKRIQIVSSYKYLGIEFSTGNSWGKATRTLSDQANKALSQLRFISSQVGGLQIHPFFKVFNSIVAPILLYGSEMWGSGYYFVIERVQTKACKFFLGVNSSTPNSAALGECGKPTLHTFQLIRLIKYWVRIIQLPDYRYPKIVYKMLHRLDVNGKINWASAVKNILLSYGFGYAWFAQDIGNEIAFVNSFAQRVLDISHQDWVADLASNGRLNSYREFKSLRISEYYFDI